MSDKDVSTQVTPAAPAAPVAPAELDYPDEILPPGAPAVQTPSVVATPLPDDVVFERLYDAVAQREAYRLFIVERAALKDIAKRVGVPMITLLEWIRLGSWAVRRGKLISIQAQAEAQLISLDRQIRRRDAVDAQAETGKKLRERAAEMIEDAATPQALRNLSETVKSATDVETRALGMDERGKTGAEDEEDENEKTAGKNPLVVIIQGGGLPPVRQV